jgi:hypothetical protein
MSRPTVSAQYINQYLSLNGDGTGEIEMVGNYSSAEGIFYFEVPAGYHMHANRLIVYLRDTGAFDAAKYGNNVTLAAGIFLEIVNESDVVQTTLTPRPVRTNSEWGSFCYDIVNHSFGTGDEFLLVRWTFGHATAPGIEQEISGSGARTEGFPPLELPTGWKLRARLNDDLSGLNEHRICVQGIQINLPHVHG